MDEQTVRLDPLQIVVTYILNHPSKNGVHSERIALAGAETVLGDKKEM
jgi:hypothetical protein